MAEANAAARLQPVDIAAMRAAVERQRATTDPQDMITSNRRFHFSLLDRCDNQWLLRFVGQLWEALEPHRALSYRRGAAAGDSRRAEAIIAEHEAIVTAFEEGDTPRALHLLAEHRREGRADFQRLLYPADPDRQ
ncbi:GntR family transcriptional regulator [Streptacidiphilus sp. 4-A2]|nr:GntR family transcriptional regulator [Streptacidiphilus sp. 4-A2]